VAVSQRGTGSTGMWHPDFSISRDALPGTDIYQTRSKLKLRSLNNKELMSYVNVS
jgi:hypothetical protein